MPPRGGLVCNGDQLPSHSTSCRFWRDAVISAIRVAAAVRLIRAKWSAPEPGAINLWYRSVPPLDGWRLPNVQLSRRWRFSYVVEIGKRTESIRVTVKRAIDEALVKAERREQCRDTAKMFDPAKPRDARSVMASLVWSGTTHGEIRFVRASASIASGFATKVTAFG
jgi:hypothetical protein